MSNKEYLDMNYFLYMSLIVEYTNNFPKIVSCCENILNGSYVIYKHFTSKNSNKCKMLCIHNEDTNKNNIDDYEIYNEESMFIKDIVQSEYIDLKELWEITDKKIYIVYRIIDNNIVPISISENKNNIMKVFSNLKNVYLIYLNTNKYYKTNYDMEEFKYIS